MIWSVNLNIEISPFSAGFTLGVVLMIIAFWGEPDLLDLLIAYLLNQ